MSISLAVLLPVLLLGIVSVLCFVGCDAGGLGGTFGGEIPPPFTQYSGLTVLGTPSIAAYWPLDDALETDPARERVTNFPNSPLNGSYVDLNTVATVYPQPPPAIYPWPQSPPLPNPGKKDVLSAAVSMPTLNLGQASLVMGDAKQAGNPAVLTTGMVVNGCYVMVPFDARWNPSSSFTIEAWVRVDWQSSDPLAWRAVLDGRALAPAFQGFAIIATVDEKNPVYDWAVILGNGGTGPTGFSTLIDNAGPPITLLNPMPAPEQPPSAPVYLAVTYDATNPANNILTLFVDGKLRKSMTSPTPLYQPNTSSPLYIGAGAPYAPLRQVGGGSPTDGPLFPFVGAIQDVAIYGKALSATDITSHFTNGIGILN